MKSIPFIFIFISVCLFVLVSGCGPRHVKLSGRITYSDNDEPLDRGTISLTNGVTQARGEIGKDGGYVISSFTDGDGLPPGSYRVYITGAATYVTSGPASPRGGGGRAPEGAPALQVLPQVKEVLLIDAKYTRAETSGLTVTVDSKTKKFDFQVDRAK